MARALLKRPEAQRVAPRGLCVLGATGSIGVSTLDVVARHPDRYRPIALTGNRDVARMLAQCLEFRPAVVAMADTGAAKKLTGALLAAGSDIQVLAGAAGLNEAAQWPGVDVVMAAIVGGAGLPSTFAAAQGPRRVLIANKEPLVMAGALLQAQARDAGAELLPIDSEHNAIFQCLPARARTIAEAGVRRVVLTCSGGPFHGRPGVNLATVSPDEACAHPKWRMGRKISVDSATLMNKGLEVIEACQLFGARPEDVDVVIHPQSIVHSMVEYCDGSILAQLGNPDMRTPIAHALAWPERIESGVQRLDLLTMGSLEFQPVDHVRFPCLGLAYAAARTGGRAPVILNAANEVAVAAFLAGRLHFTGIAVVVAEVLAGMPAGREPGSLEEVVECDAEARAAAEVQVTRGASG